ncbi:putative 3-Dehydro-bile acid delta(4,6)-reductase, FAD/NAD(P)-binding domain superfamily [Helianthus annuus]|uniref:3-Dehydro-bile acid delta(4,6)-reductase, FAD/NAD(P)-binding domain superfamily n=1 Tax=Helianthus annuus TaxID=4232 RepID=A0A251TXN3_HELAN|nr:putative 3-Dehydro-bile acid delta(4,6)-reductase, FAD/NAD(P)-binding domain superfamily [Helianthus annuus]KAJ0527098.1 putative 3-Dehydro-bile acid delta(4,6)-reductase, FAD/NAD(P)-binding domain superfamily [Helianthus annuus]KAJ0535716.1 putative 3-Dehydro-bile acid delta(4,6)-reductase, FAD/NAD(P)-binding domain superfamily [Helianthus annuus]KAJ0543497.1 putative 3-Dehydro-bile acid delta(4,6)-reductase, FAD/NAD(P)-binding domain superfamily [Helianthus annuus]KAJ0629302.1 putative 3-D
MSWFSDHRVELKTEEDGRVFPVSDNPSSIVDCLLNEARQRGVKLQIGKSITSASTSAGGKFTLKIDKRTIDYVEFIEADYLLIASGSNQQGYNLANQFGHSIIKPVPSVFTFKIDDKPLSDYLELHSRKSRRV